jgi:hypothetical protein
MVIIWTNILRSSHSDADDANKIDLTPRADPKGIQKGIYYLLGMSQSSPKKPSLPSVGTPVCGSHPIAS